MDSVIVKNAAELALMRESGRLLASVFAMLDDFIEVGMSTMRVNDHVEEFIVQYLHARPASKGQYDFPYVLNTSVNEVVCHGVPSSSCILASGDIINVDITLEKNGYIADSSKMYRLGKVSAEASKLVEASYEAMWRGIRAVRPGARMGDIGHAIQQYAESEGYTVVRDYCGHGIGQQMHEAPMVLHHGKPGTGLVLQEGMTFTVEPMINQGVARTRTLKDGWTVVTRDSKLSAQWEHTLAVTATGFEVLTLRDEERALFAN